MKLEQRKEYLSFEKNLKRMYRHIRKNELSLTYEDFENGHLKDSSFIRLTEESWFIPYSEEIVVKIPIIKRDVLYKDLGFFAVRALSKIKSDRLSLLWQAIALFLVGVFVLGVLHFTWDSIKDIVFLTELITIISWVFIWTAVSKWFIEQRDLQDKRFTILQLLSAKIITYEDSEDRSYDKK